LQSLPKLEFLTLIDTDVSDVGYEHLKKLTKLKYLNLHHTKITPAGFAMLKAAMPYCKIRH